jgi:molybdopterin molybdotransferase
MVASPKPEDHRKPAVPWSQAYATARDTPRPLPAEHTSAAAAIGRVLAAPVRAATAVPAFDTAAMDGYAVAGPGPWTVTGQLMAGHTGTTASLPPGTAVEIATGARVPDGADAVVPYEQCHRDGMTVAGPVGPRDHIRRLGKDVRAGDTLISAGRFVTATVIAAAVQVGVDTLVTHRPAQVSLLVTGDEVISQGTPGPGQVRDSFTGLVGAVTARAGGRMHASRHIPDDPAQLTAALDHVDADVVVVSGSSSAGTADHLHRVLTARRAHWHVRGVACRPGHPQALARMPDGQWVVSLPGNPFAGLVAALTLLEPLVRALVGQVPANLPTAAVTGRANLVPDGVRIVPVQHQADPASMRVIASRGSASLHTVAAADALAVLSADWADGESAIILAIP